MKKLKIAVTVILLILIATGAALHVPCYSQTGYALDTVITLTAYGKNAKVAVRTAFDRIFEIDNKFNAYDKNSEVYRINAANAEERIYLDDEVYNLLSLSVEYSKKTNGVFDITVKPLADLWGIGTQNEKVPHDDEISQALSKLGYENLELDDKNKSVTKKKNGMSVDFGGIAKGYASDCAIGVLKEYGINSAYIDLGGNVATIGKMPLEFSQMLKYGSTKRKFLIGIQAPDKQRGEIYKTIESENDFIVTSGDYERFFEKDGVRYHHIMDKRTGAPARSGLRSVTVIGDSGTICDILSTTIFIEGADSAKKYSDLFRDIILIED